MKTVPNPRGDRPVVVPTRTDGTYYRFEMIHHGGKLRTYADTPGGLVAALIDGYDDIDADDHQAADEARLAYTGTVQVQMQAAFNAAGNLDAMGLKVRELLSRPRNRPVIVDTWPHAIPLVVLTTDYLDRDRPGEQHNLVWLDPTSDTALLASLAAVGVIVISER